jgi:hypothetical protein
MVHVLAGKAVTTLPRVRCGSLRYTLRFWPARRIGNAWRHRAPRSGRKGEGIQTSFPAHREGPLRRPANARRLEIPKGIPTQNTTASDQIHTGRLPIHSVSSVRRVASTQSLAAAGNCLCSSCRRSRRPDGRFAARKILGFACRCPRCPGHRRCRPANHRTARGRRKSPAAPRRFAPAPPPTRRRLGLTLRQPQKRLSASKRDGHASRPAVLRNDD